MSYPNNPQGYPQQYPQQSGYGQPHYGQPGYGHAGYQPGYPGYYGEFGGKPPRANPFAGILLLIGGIAGILVGVLPWAQSGDSIGVIAAFDLIDAGSSSGASAYGGDEAIMLGIAILAAVLGGLLALGFSFPMFAARRHSGASSGGLIGALLMLAGGVLVIVVSDGQVFESSEIVHWLLIFCGLPALIGALIGYAVT